MIENLRAEYLLEARQAIRPYMLDRLDCIWPSSTTDCDHLRQSLPGRADCGGNGISNLIGTRWNSATDSCGGSDEEAHFRGEKCIACWIGASHGFSMQQCWFSDSLNDLPLLERVAHPAVPPRSHSASRALQRCGRLSRLRAPCAPSQNGFPARSRRGPLAGFIP